MQSRLWNACDLGDIPTVKHILAIHPEWIHLRTNGEKKSLLHFAGNRATAEFLVESGLPVDVRDEQGRSPIYDAILRRRVEVVDYLLKQGTKWDERDYFNAISMGMLTVVQYFVERGMDVKKGRPLFYALFHGNWEVACYLLERGADPNDGFLLHIAARRGNLQVVKKLIESGADVNVMNDYGRTPLYLAISSGDLDKVRYFIEHGADPSLDSPLTLLGAAAYSGSIEMVDYLLGLGLSFEKTEDTKNKWIRYVRDEEMFKYICELTGYSEEKAVHRSKIPLSPHAFDQIEAIGIEKEVACVRLHPERDELIGLIQGGKLAKWFYSPQLQLEQVMKTRQYTFNDLHFSPGGEKIYLSAPNTWGVEIRRYEDLQVEQVLKNQDIQDTTRELGLNTFAVSPDGRYLILEIDSLEEKDGVGLFDLVNETYKKYSWKSLGFIDEGKFFYGCSHQMMVSPNGEKVAFCLFLEDEGADLFIFEGILGKKKQVIQYNMRQHKSRKITGLAFSPDSNHIALFRSGPCQVEKHPAGWIGDLTLLSTERKERRWQISMDVTITKMEQSLGEQGFPNGFASKVLVGEKEVICTLPGGQLFFFDIDTGHLIRRTKVNGKYILALGWHRDGNKIRVATERELQVIQLV